MPRCALCPGVNTCLPPDGHGDLLFIGEAPGKQEQQRGRVFIGSTGREVNEHYLPLAGMHREGVVFTNAIGCLPTSAGGKLDAKAPKDRALLQSCAEANLYPLIQRGGFRALVPLGSFAIRAVCPDVDLEVQHGFPVETRFGIPAFPMWHPARGIHEPKKMLGIREDWQRLRSYLHGTLRLPVDPYPTPHYRELTDPADLDELDPTLPLAGDTETTKRREPYCFTGSQSPGSGWLIRATSRPILERLGHLLRRWEAPLLFHNWLFDWPVVEAMGLRFPHHLTVDTMARVFHLGNLPQGLKALAYRELGMRMQDFEDVVTPHSTPRVLDYYRQAQRHTWEKPESSLEQDSKTGLYTLYQPQSLSTKLKRFFTDYGKNPEKDVFQMWEKNWVAEQAALEATCGEWPGLCISHVPFEQILYYACRDADALIRLWPILQHMQRRVRRASQEQWRA